MQPQRQSKREHKRKMFSKHLKQVNLVRLSMPCNKTDFHIHKQSRVREDYGSWHSPVSKLKNLAFISMVQNYTLMLSVAPSTAFFKLQRNWAIRIIHWLQVRTRWREKPSHWSFLWRVGAEAQFTPVEAEHLGWTIFESQFLKQKEPLQPLCPCTALPPSLLCTDCCSASFLPDQCQVI